MSFMKASGIHPLRRWLFDHQMTIDQFAMKSGVDIGTLSRIMNRRIAASPGAIDKIIKATRRAVTVEDFG